MNGNSTNNRLKSRVKADEARRERLATELRSNLRKRKARAKLLDAIEKRDDKTTTD